MSRGEQRTTFNAASGENQAYNTEAQTSFDTTQKDIGDYASAVGKFNAGNPYVKGGEAETATNQQLSDTAAGLAESAGQTLQGAAVRTGQNSGGAIAATEEMQRENERALTGQEATATEKRLAANTGYKEAGLAAGEKIPGMEDTVASQEGQLAEGALKTQEEAAKTPSFGDTLGGAFTQGLGQAAGTAGAAMLFG